MPGSRPDRPGGTSSRSLVGVLRGRASWPAARSVRRLPGLHWTGIGTLGLRRSPSLHARGFALWRIRGRRFCGSRTELSLGLSSGASSVGAPSGHRCFEHCCPVVRSRPLPVSIARVHAYPHPWAWALLVLRRNSRLGSRAAPRRRPIPSGDPPRIRLPRRGSARIAITRTGGSRSRGGRSFRIDPAESAGDAPANAMPISNRHHRQKVWGAESWIWGGPSTRMRGGACPRSIA